jgi:cyanophycinase
MSAKREPGTLALVGGGEWLPECRGFDVELIAASDAKEVVVLPTAAAFEHPEHAVERAEAYFAELDLPVAPLRVLNRREAEDKDTAADLRKARFVYVADGSPLHLRSVLKDSLLFAALLDAYGHGATIAASGAGATVLCDPMVDPRGGAYTVGLGIVANLAVFPYHGSSADHMRARSIDLLPRGAVLAGIDSSTALVREPSGVWRVAGAGSVTLYGAEVDVGAGAVDDVDEAVVFAAPSVIETLRT